MLVVSHDIMPENAAQLRGATAVEVLSTKCRIAHIPYLLPTKVWE